MEILPEPMKTMPVISDMRFEVAGQQFHCAPFSGWYLQSEIAARNRARVARCAIQTTAPFSMLHCWT